MSADLGLTEGNLTEAASVQVLLSDLKGFHVSSEAPQKQGPQSLPEPHREWEVGQGAPCQSPEQLLCPSCWESPGV